MEVRERSIWRVVEVTAHIQQAISERHPNRPVWAPLLVGRIDEIGEHRSHIFE